MGRGKIASTGRGLSMIAIALVVIRTRQHLAAVKPQKRGLMLELMHFPEELLDAPEFNALASRRPAQTRNAQFVSSMICLLICGHNSSINPSFTK
jgi:non-homologous end joining protein Ku